VRLSYRTATRTAVGGADGFKDGRNVNFG
jgi:hypothetical protein